MKKTFFLIIIFVCSTLAMPVWGADSTYRPVNGDAYFDVATGNKYIKNPDQTYTQFSRNGKLRKTDVSPIQPRLMSSPYIVPLKPESYLVYEISKSNKKDVLILPAAASHPKGWRIKELLYTQDKKTDRAQMALGYTKASQPVLFENNKLIATADCYFDKASGNKYIKNPDQTYSKFSRRGVLLRKDIPNTHPRLISGKYVTEMGDNDYLVYQSWQNNSRVEKILPFSAGHPENWRCESILHPVQKPGR